MTRINRAGFLKRANPYQVSARTMLWAEREADKTIARHTQKRVRRPKP